MERYAGQYDGSIVDLAMATAKERGEFTTDYVPAADEVTTLPLSKTYSASMRRLRGFVSSALLPPRVTLSVKDLQQSVELNTSTLLRFFYTARKQSPVYFEFHNVPSSDQFGVLRSTYCLKKFEPCNPHVERIHRAIQDALHQSYN